jgi:two-component system OmpR family sensor kinase
MTYRTRLLVAYLLLWALLLFLVLAVASLRIRQDLEARTEQTLIEDTLALAKLYREPRTGSVPTPSLGGVSVALYLTSGLTVPRHPEVLLPKAVLQRARERPQLYRVPGWRTAYVRLPLGVLALSEPTGYIHQLASSVAQALLRSFLILLPLGALLVLVVGGFALTPLQRAAQAIAQRGPEHLEPLPYRGPEDELGRIVQRFNALLVALKEAREREQSFLAEVSHELRTPLTALTGYLERLARNPQDPLALQGAQRTAEHLARLVGDLLALARGEAERSVNPHIVELGELLEQAVHEYPGVIYRPPSEPLEVLGDPDRLLQLVRNLLANAVRAAGRPEGVVLELEPKGQEAWIRVIDDGPGIPPELQGRLFTRFARGPGGGTGLGLAIARQIAEAHGGSIQVHSEPGRTCFQVVLPLLEEG